MIEMLVIFENWCLYLIASLEIFSLTSRQPFDMLKWLYLPDFALLLSEL